MDGILSVGYDSGFVTVGGSKVFLFCGEIHYFRVPKGVWTDRLLKARRAGLNCIASYIPWNWHEPVEGRILFGDEHPQSPYESKAFSRDLLGYIELVKKLGMFFIARPGPYICSEWDSGGHPNWLYEKSHTLRSLDPDYIRYSEKWYSTVLPIIERTTYPKGGPTLLLQIENEYFWGDAPYLMRLYEIARRYIRDIPIITNEDWYVEETPIVNTIDDYPPPWSVREFDSKVRRYTTTQPGRPKVFMELEGGWFSTFGAPLPTNRGSFPAEWTETLIKSAIAMGINGISVYMFHGGTNPGYYTGKYITTTYDYEAAIREWGELSQRYYGIKRVALFVKTFHDLISRTRPVDGAVAVSGNIEAFARVGESGEAVVVLRNLSESPHYTRVLYRGEHYPLIGSIRVPPRNAKIVLLNYRLSGTPFKILYTSSEPLLMETVDGNSVVIVYGDALELGEVGVEASEPLEIEFTDGVVVSRLDAGKVVVSCIHDSSDRIAVLKSGSSRLYIIAVSRSRANRTWYIDDERPPLILISNIYFVGRLSTVDGRSIVELELDENSCGYVTLVSFKPLSRATVAGKQVPLEHVYGLVYRFYINGCDGSGRGVVISVDNSWRSSTEALPQGGGTTEAGKPLEELGMLFNGYAVYSIEFDLDREILDSIKDAIMYINYFNDYITAELNGTPIGSGYHSLEADVSLLLKEGKNRLNIILESTGHPNDGLIYTPNGIVGRVYIGRIGEELLDSWRYVEYTPKYGVEFSMSSFLRNPKEVEDVLLNLESGRGVKHVEVISSPGVYISSLYIDKKVGRYILDLSRAMYSNYYPRALLFINKRFVGVYIGPVDITDHIVEGENEIAIAVERTPGLAPLIKRYQYAVDGVWRVKEYTEGLANGWYREDYDDSKWELVELPLYMENSMGRLVWLRGRVYIEGEENAVAPLRITIRGSGFRALLYFNGQLIGRYADEGPQTEFYIPEQLIRRGENKVAVLLHTVSTCAHICRLSVEPYYIHRSVRVELS
ncbi:MAG: beta-galactosidase [Ignisphaera sp.]|nr:beta-galactosidase [Ignisphaera sp.]MDW8084827.1 beta-galactosidase [Ignisphaera sp.]